MTFHHFSYAIDVLKKLFHAFCAASSSFPTVLPVFGKADVFTFRASF